MLVTEVNEGLERQIRRAMREVALSGVDFRGAVDQFASHMILVRAQDPPDVAYILDTRNIRVVRTIMIRESAPQIRKFNIFEQILPRFARNAPVKHRVTQLENTCVEYRLLAKLFTDTFGGAPNINSILKLENQHIQVNFIQEL